MSAGGAFGGARGFQPRPPEKGVFPLDHFGECKKIKEQYLECLQQHGSDAKACREVAKAYLVCRMDRNLMAQQDLKDLGFAEGSGPAHPRKQQQDTPAAAMAAGGTPPPPQQQQQQGKRRIQEEGFLAGMQRFDKS